VTTTYVENIIKPSTNGKNVEENRTLQHSCFTKIFVYQLIFQSKPAHCMSGHDVAETQSLSKASTNEESSSKMGIIKNMAK